MARSGWAALAVTVPLVGGLGSKPALDAAADAERKVAPLLDALTRFPAWDVSAQGFESKMYGPVGLKMVVLAALVFLLARGAGKVGASSAAFLAGWGSLMLASAAAGVAYVVSADMVVLDGRLADEGGGAGAVVIEGLNSGVIFGLYTGWLVGLVVVATARRAVVDEGHDWDEAVDDRSMRMPSLPSATAAPSAIPAGAARQSASAAAARGDSLGGMTLVPGMSSVTPSPTGAATPWAANRQQPTRQPEPTASGAWAAPSAPVADSAGSGEPFVPAGSWPAKTPQPGTDTSSGSFITPGAWPPTPRPETPATGGPAASGEWPNGGGAVPPASYEQPEYSGLAPSTPEPTAPTSTLGGLPVRGRAPAATGQMPATGQIPTAGGGGATGAGQGPATGPLAGAGQRVPPSSRQAPGTGQRPSSGSFGGAGGPLPSSRQRPGQPAPAPGSGQLQRPGRAQAPGQGQSQAQGPMLQSSGSGPAAVEQGTAGQPLWPSKWPASAGGAYTDDPDVHTSAKVRRPPRGPGAPTDGDVGVDPPEEGRADPETRFW
jgi:hypothetical protein